MPQQCFRDPEKDPESHATIFTNVSVCLHFALFPTSREAWSIRKDPWVSKFLYKASVTRDSKLEDMRTWRERRISTYKSVWEISVDSSSAQFEFGHSRYFPKYVLHPSQLHCWSLQMSSMRINPATLPRLPLLCLSPPVLVSDSLGSSLAVFSGGISALFSWAPVNLSGFLLSKPERLDFKASAGPPSTTWCHVPFVIGLFFGVAWNILLGGSPTSTKGEKSLDVQLLFDPVYLSSL